MFLRYIILFLGMFFICSASASDNISLSSTTDSIEIYDTFQVIISVSGDISGELEIPGIESFDVISQSQGSNFQNINGQISSSQNYSLMLQAKSVGQYTLGPITIRTDTEEIVDDEIETIQVRDSFSGNSVAIEDGGDKTQEDQTGIRPLRSMNFPWLLLIGVITIFFVLFFFLLRQYLQREESVQSPSKYVPEIEDTTSVYKKYLLLFQDFGEKQKSISSKDFSQVFHTHMRNLLEELGIPNAKSATLKELNQYSSEFLPILKESYNYEFSSQEIDIKTRNQIIEKVIQELKKYM